MIKNNKIFYFSEEQTNAPAEDTAKNMHWMVVRQFDRN